MYADVLIRYQYMTIVIKLMYVFSVRTDIEPNINV